MDPSDRPRDEFRYQPEDVATFAEQFTLEPVSPAAIRERVDEGQVLVTADIPGYLDRELASDADASIALYRLVQLFGTPNVPGLEAGADQPTRERTTWQYLFRVRYQPDEDGHGVNPDENGHGATPGGSDSWTHLVSVYDYETDVSVGVAEWYRPDDVADRAVPEPSPEPLPSTTMPDEERLGRLVQLVLATVEHVVEATYEDLRV